jgi:hypothetical protein
MHVECPLANEIVQRGSCTAYRLCIVNFNYPNACYREGNDVYSAVLYILGIQDCATEQNGVGSLKYSFNLHS